MRDGFFTIRHCKHHEVIVSVDVSARRSSPTLGTESCCMQVGTEAETHAPSAPAYQINKDCNKEQELTVGNQEGGQTRLHTPRARSRPI